MTEAEVPQDAPENQEEDKVQEEAPGIPETRPEIEKLKSRAESLNKRITTLYDETPKPEYGPAPDPDILENLEKNCADTLYW